MLRRKNPVPVYKHHKPTDSARCWVNDCWVILGRYGSPESKAEFERVCAEVRTAARLKSTPTPSPAPAPGQSATVNDVLLAFWRHAETHYRRPDGTPTAEISEYRQAFRVVRPLYGRGRPPRSARWR